jgi:hypothetical protein
MIVYTYTVFDFIGAMNFIANTSEGLTRAADVDAIDGEDNVNFFGNEWIYIRDDVLGARDCETDAPPHVRATLKLMFDAWGAWRDSAEAAALRPAANAAYHKLREKERALFDEHNRRIEERLTDEKGD